MTRFVQLHLLTAYPAANLNRDDTGRPKTLTFGNAERLRVSSQSLKRAFRTSAVFAEKLPDALGKRSQDFMRSLVSALEARGVEAAEAATRAEALIEHDKLGKVKKGKAQTEQLVHLGPDELAIIEGLADRLAGDDALDEKSMVVLKDKPRAADIAMFGRMLADNSGFNVEAAVQVAHAFTTHRVSVEDDYYTAVDDLKNADRDQDRGAGFIGVQEYGAGLFYLYICINADLLAANLSGDLALCADTIEALIRAATTVSPTGKQNAFASRAKASYALIEIGDETPRTLASAFQLPVGARKGEDDQIEASIRRLRDLRGGFAKAYDERFDVTKEMVVDDAEGATLGDVIDAARAVFHPASVAA
jgi:CRISPR system Cascade subunit CasC